METETLGKGRFLKLVKSGIWEYAVRTSNMGAVMIIAITDNHEMILAEEFRVPVGQRVIGLPAGISGDMGDESELETAKRELLEEVGYVSDCWQYLMKGPSSPGLTSETVSFFYASQAQRTEQGGGVEGESIQTHIIPLAEIHDWLQKKQASGVLIDPRVYAALYFAQFKS